MQQLPMTYSDRAERRCNKDSNDYKQFMLYRSMLEYKTLLMKIIMTDLNEWKSWATRHGLISGDTVWSNVSIPQWKEQVKLKIQKLKILPVSTMVKNLFGVSPKLIMKQIGS